MRADEQPVVFSIQCQAGGLAAGRDRPVRDDLVFRRVDHRDVVLVLDVDEHASGAVRHAGLGFTSKRDGGDNLS